MRDALKKDKVAFIEISTEIRDANVIVVTIVTGPESQDAANKCFVEVAKRFKTFEMRREFKTPEELAGEKAATLRTILAKYTNSSKRTGFSISMCWFQMPPTMTPSNQSRRSIRDCLRLGTTTDTPE
jgi:hypothetical protein